MPKPTRFSFRFRHPEPTQEKCDGVLQFTQSYVNRGTLNNAGGTSRMEFLSGSLGGVTRMAERPHVTDLLDAVARGEEAARNELFERVYLELKRIARSQLRRSGDWISVNPTTLLHEAWLKFSRTDGRELQGSTHFYNVLSQAMRHVLTDIARSRVTTKRGHQFVRVELNERIEQPDSPLTDLLAVDTALGKLQACDPELAQLVEWHFFGGISFVDIAKLRGVTERTVRRHWDLARLFLMNAIESVG